MLDTLEDVFHHHNRIVNYKTSCEYHTEQRQQVDRKPEEPQEEERRNQRYRNRNDRDDRRAPGAQEHEDDKYDQAEGNHQRFYNFRNCIADKPCVVERNIQTQISWCLCL